MIDDNIVDKIKNLNEKAKSAEAIGEMKEAETFAAAVRNLLLKYELDTC
jgi:hypothetical protein